MSNPLDNELLGNPLSSSANAGQYEAGDTISTVHGDMEVTGVDFMGRPQVDRYGEDLNWEDSFGPASKHLGVSEAEWEAFISGVNDIKAEMRQYEGNDARVMQQRSQGEDPVAERRIGVLMNTQGLTREQAENEVYNSEQYIQSNEQFEQYNELNQQLNDLYASVGLDATGAIQGSGTSSPGYAVNFDFVSGDVSHTKGDAIHDIGKMAVMAAAGVVAGPALAGALGGVLGPAAAKAASSAIINLASQYMTTGEVDWKQALISAATSYGGAKLGEALKGSSALGGIGDKISGVTDKFNEVLDKTGSIGSAAIKAGGMSMLTQMVTTGEIDVKQAGLAALMAGGSAGLSEWQASMEAAGAEVTADDLQEIVVEAKRVGTDVGGGMTMLEGGLVINEAGEIIGNMTDIDLDGDGMLSANDLQEITTPDRDLVNPNPNENIYGDVDLAPPDATTNPDAFTKGWMEDRYAGMTREQMIKQMQADGFGYDPETGKFEDYAQEYLDEWDAANDLNLQELNTASYGGIDVNMEDPYTIGQTDEGQFYIAKTNESTGEVSFKVITEEQYNELYDRMYGYQGSDEFGPPEGYESAIVSGDYSDVEDYLVSESLADGGNIITGGFDEDGNPLGNVEGISVDDWVTLEEGSFNNTAVPIDDFVDAKPEQPEPVEPEKVENNNSSANSNANSSTDAGEGDKGGGNTNATGGAGASGAIGGGGTPGAGAPAGGAAGGDNNEIVVDINNPLTGGNVTDNVVTDNNIVDPSNGTGTPVAPPMNSRIQALMDAGMTYEEAVANQNAAIAAGADANGDGMVTDEEWAAHTGLGGAGGSSGGTDTNAGTGGEGGGTSSGAGNTGGGDAGTNTGAGQSGSGSGSGESGNTSGGDGIGGGAGNEGGTDTGTNGGEGGGFYHGGSTGVGAGSGTEPGAGGGAGGGGEGGGEGVGLLAGFDNYTPQWGELFEYTTITPYQAKQLEPVRQYIAKAKGMLS